MLVGRQISYDTKKSTPVGSRGVSVSPGIHVTNHDRRRPRLSPVYDIVPTVLFMPGDDLGLNLRESKSFEAVTVESFDILGRKSHFGVAEARQRAREAVDRTLTNWSALEPYLTWDNFRYLTNRRRSLALVTPEN